MSALTAERLHTYYGKSHILDGVSIDVADGKITTLLGRNGAGKTTTLRSLLGLTPPREGRVTIFGKDTTRWPTFRVAGLDRERDIAHGDQATERLRDVLDFEQAHAWLFRCRKPSRPRGKNKTTTTNIKPISDCQFVVTLER